MASSYYNSSSNGGPSYKNNHAPSLLARLIAGLPSGLAAQMQRLWDLQNYNPVSAGQTKSPRSLRQVSRSWNARRLLSLPHLLVALWVLLLLWGERWVFQSAIKACEWGKWERWPEDATPHHLVFLADPQLIDPHTYPGRPWPLSKFTYMHTDNYMRRSYIQLQKRLHPDTVFFLGDLFDGGREWKTAQGNTVDPGWANGLRPSGEQAYVKTWGKRYGEDFWLREYDRFGKIFYNFWNLAGVEAGPGQRGRKIVSTLPGNHDLGFGSQIKIPVRNRFEAYFGEGNRVDVVGNHTFVSVDSVSISAGSSEHSTEELIKPSEDFLKGVQAMKRKAVARELNYHAGKETSANYAHLVEDLDQVDFEKSPSVDLGAGSAEFPTILLTHVPLYRNPGTPCGPQREHWPPKTPLKGQTSPVVPDHRNAISVSRGYQYQNVLSEEDSVKIVSSIGNVVSVFSGDDHDYCEIVHPANKNNAREITVKSMSWAMGVRKPGFLMLSMWNPVDGAGNSLPNGHSASISHPSQKTMQSQLCLQPNQLAIFIRYLILLIISLLAITVRAILTPILHLEPFSSPSYTGTDDAPLLPTSKRPSEVDTKHHSTNSSTSSTNLSNLAPRASRTRSVSPSGYGLPPAQPQVRFATPPTTGYSPSKSWDDDEDSGSGKSGAYAKPMKSTPLEVIWREMWTSVWRVSWIVVGLYLWLCWKG